MPHRSIKLSKNAASTPLTPAEEFNTGGGRRERKLQQTIDHIGAVAWRMFETQGFDAVTMEAIAEAADVAKGTLYKHFPVKEALIQHRFEKDMLAQRDTVGVAAMAMSTCAARLACLFREEEIYAEKMRPYIGAYIHYRLGSRQTSQGRGTSSGFERFVAEVLRQGQASGELVSDMPAERMAEYMTFLRLAVLVRWLATPGASLRPMYEEMLRLFLNGVSGKVRP